MSSDADRMVRTARAPRDLSGALPLGVASRSSAVFVARLGVAASRHRSADADAPDPVALPWGVWPRAVEQPLAADELEGALASYAAALRRKRAPRREPAKRGLPLVARRAGDVAAGASRGPAGLSKALRPEDASVPSLDAMTAREVRPPSMPKPMEGASALRHPAPRKKR